MKNVRFWTLIHGCPVKLTLSIEQSISWGCVEPTEEGWSSEYGQWYFDGEYVYREWFTDGRDCDGRLSTYQHQLCEPSKLKAWKDPGNACGQPFGVDFPYWEDIDNSQRDYQAEAAGY